MNKKLILTALIALACGCQQNSSDNTNHRDHNKCNKDKCKTSNEEVEQPKAVEKEQAAVVVTPQKADVAVAVVAPEVKAVEVKAAEVKAVEVKAAEAVKPAASDAKKAE